MDRKAFLTELRRMLEVLPFDEREAAIAYYEEYLDEAGPERERETIESFGTCAEIAARLRADYAVSTPPKTPREGFSKVWLVILAIFAFPLAFPLLIAVMVFIFSMFVAFFSVIFAIGVTSVALVGSGIFSVIGGIAVFVSDPLTTLFFFGGGVAAVGMGILLGYATYAVATKLMGVFAQLLGWILHRVKARRDA